MCIRDSPQPLSNPIREGGVGLSLPIRERRGNRFPLSRARNLCGAERGQILCGFLMGTVIRVGGYAYSKKRIGTCSEGRANGSKPLKIKV